MVRALRLLHDSALAALALLALPACGGGGTYQGGVYHDSQATYDLGSLGPGWSRVDLGDQNDLAFRNDSVDGVVQVNASCDPSLDIPLEALTNHLLIGFTEREDVEPQERVPLDAREALRTHMRAKLDGVPRELLFYVLKKNDCVYDFALVTPPGELFERARPDFERLVAGFHADAGGSS
jgi:hypothetical protein